MSLDLVWCEHHQAWTLSLHQYLEDGESISDVAPPTVVRFGPFDDWMDVQVAAVRVVSEAMYRFAPG